MCLNVNEKGGFAIENVFVEVLVTGETQFTAIKRVSFRQNVDGETRCRWREIC